MKIYLIFVFTCVGILVRCSASDQFGEKKSSEKMEKSEQVNTLSINKPDQQSDASNVEAATELSGVRRANARKNQNDAVDDALGDAKSQSTESNRLPTSTQLSTIELFDKYLEKYGAEMRNNKGLTFEDLVKHLEKEELMLMTKAYEVLANGHDNLVKKLREHALTTTTTTPRPPVFQSRSLRYRPKYKKLSSKQPARQDPTLFFINDGRIYSIKRHS
ncbi:hypothetical protein BpHYR1_039171 [Brachionus plicatilis]|uniref:Uncharacterized protein n=1 Tax=Brachionus plicatilis TaxID=10195 RepID=A0A3M7QNG5_BRAPC|nr:hypothetical protein BpHYR1_039171 [Brachionus plicatilis]